MKTANERASGAPEEPGHSERHHSGHGEVAVVGMSRMGDFGGARWCKRVQAAHKGEAKLMLQEID